jgi:penicillin-binding protein 2
VENQGFGTTYAAPIASLMIEKYLTGEVKRTWYEDWVRQVLPPVVNTRSTDTVTSDSTTSDTTHQNL